METNAHWSNLMHSDLLHVYYSWIQMGDFVVVVVVVAIVGTFGVHIIVNILL